MLRCVLIDAENNSMCISAWAAMIKWHILFSSLLKRLRPGISYKNTKSYYRVPAFMTSSTPNQILGRWLSIPLLHKERNSHSQKTHYSWGGVIMRILPATWSPKWDHLGNDLNWTLWAPGSVREPASENIVDSGQGRHPKSTSSLHTYIHEHMCFTCM